ncbi:hypothetical protein LTR36_007546 [Oleoguttula mirabilis]|uniref:Uncharacterized protein n=1 Tax=Oleoguttula mirabilis TaxID=1507867 RepID=A0AAV9JUW6_9PEZI|nr:hypothetical protein LTR36_007546 [Oleoguttula mirabilis]
MGPSNRLCGRYGQHVNKDQLDFAFDDNVATAESSLPREQPLLHPGTEDFVPPAPNMVQKTDNEYVPPHDGQSGEVTPVAVTARTGSFGAPGNRGKKRRLEEEHEDSDTEYQPSNGPKKRRTRREYPTGLRVHHKGYDKCAKESRKRRDELIAECHTNWDTVDLATEALPANFVSALPEKPQDWSSTILNKVKVLSTLTAQDGGKARRELKSTVVAYKRRGHTVKRSAVGILDTVIDRLSSSTSRGRAQDAEPSGTPETPEHSRRTPESATSRIKTEPVSTRAPRPPTSLSSTRASPPSKIKREPRTRTPQPSTEWSSRAPAALPATQNEWILYQQHQEQLMEKMMRQAKVAGEAKAVMEQQAELARQAEAAMKALHDEHQRSLRSLHLRATGSELGNPTYIED